MDREYLSVVSLALTEQTARNEVSWSSGVSPLLFLGNDQIFTSFNLSGAFSYKKLERNGFKTGSYIVRQCEETFGHFLLDIVIRHDPETFKIVQSGQKFIFHKRDGSKETFDTLQQLAESIELPKDCHHMRFSPVSEKDRPVKLLLCAAPEALQAKEKVNDFSVMENKAPRIIHKQSLLLHKRKCGFFLSKFKLREKVVYWMTFARFARGTLLSDISIHSNYRNTQGLKIFRCPDSNPY